MDLFLASCKQIPHVAAIHVPATNSYLPFQQPSSRCPDSQGRGPVLGLLVIPDIVVQWPWLCYNLLIGDNPVPIRPISVGSTVPCGVDHPAAALDDVNESKQL